jgi:hypothetical protein
MSSKIMDWYRSNKNGLHYYFYRLCRHCEINNINIIKDNNSFRDFIELVYYYSSGKHSNSKFDTIKGLSRNCRSFSKALKRYKPKEKPKEKPKQSLYKSEDEDDDDDEVIELLETIQLMRENNKAKIMNNKLTSLYMDTDVLYKKAHEKMREIENTNKYMRIMPQWIFVKVEFEK